MPFLEERITLIEEELNEITRRLMEKPSTIDLPIYSLNQIKELGIMSKATIYGLEKKGDIQLIRKNGRTYIARDELERYMKS